MNKSAPLALLLVAFAAVPAACSKSTPPPVTPAPTPDAGADAAPMMMPSASAVPADAGAPVASADAGAPVVGVDMSAALDVGIDTALAAAAGKNAPGMKPEGPTGRATLKEGERFDMVVTLQPNRCYTFIASSPQGQVSELELHLMAPPLYTMEAGKSGANEKATPVIGKGKAGAMCPILPIAVPYRLDALARKGGGRIGVAVYARDK